MSRLARNKYLIMRRLLQVSVMVVLVGGNLFGWKILVGNLSHSELLGAVPLSDPFAVLQLLAAGGLLATEVLLGAAITLAVYGLLGGRVFCAWICPMNMVTDLANRLRPQRDDSGLAIGRSVRMWILGLALVVSFLAGTAAFEAISPIGMLHRGLVFGMGAGWLAVVAVFLFDLVVQRNGFCGHLCPLGAFYSLVGRVGLVRVRHDHQACTRCMDCLAVCPEPQVLGLIGKTDGSVLDANCTSCGRCIDVCNDDALRFDLGRHTLSDHTGG